MKAKYTATIYLNGSVIFHQDGDDLDELYSWMLIETQDKFGNHKGEIVENASGNVVRTYRKSPIE